MKITIKNESKSSEIKYPCLMQGDEGSIVFFHKFKCGVAIRSTVYGNGHYTDRWNMGHFTPFTGTIELSND